MEYFTFSADEIFIISFNEAFELLEVQVNNSILYFILVIGIRDKPEQSFPFIMLLQG